MRRVPVRQWAALALAVSLVAAAGCAGEQNPLAGVTGTTGTSTDRTIIAVFRDQADLSGVEAIANWDERGHEVVSRLQATAQRSQSDAVDLAHEAGVEPTSYWVTNALVLEGDEHLASRMSELPGVEKVFTEPVHPHTGEPRFEPAPAPTEPPANLTAVGAPSAWAASHRGTGARIGIIDTGVQADHPALASAWVGDDGWLDPTGQCTNGPCDPVGHGTHVAGLAVGGLQTPGGQGAPIGVAPGASLVAAKACDDEGCAETDLLVAAQWMLAPGGDPSARPEVVVNSWNLAPGDTSLSRLPAAWDAAGLVAVFAAGNDGPGCDTIGAPAGDPHAVAVGALTTNGGALHASSRGPASRADAPPLWAPGEDVVSSLPNSSYGTGSGTSMAAPHVAGALAIAIGGSHDAAGAVKRVLADAATASLDGCDGGAPVQVRTVAVGSIAPPS